MRPLRHARHLHREALRSLSRYLRRGEAEDLHQFRVRLKQLKALLSATGRPGLAWEPYRDLYRLSSAVRDADVTGVSPCTSPARGLLQKATRRFIRMHACLPGCAEKELQLLRKPDIEKCVIRDLRKLRTRLARIPPAGNWHALRKLCKRVLHNGRYAGWGKIPENKKGATCLIPLLEEAAEKIGRWHDQHVCGNGHAPGDTGAGARAALRRLRASLRAARCPPDWCSARKDAGS